MSAALGCAALLIVLGAGHLRENTQPLPKVTGTLVRVRGARGDSAIEVRADLTMSEGWHIGARRPGKVGIPTVLEWQLPKGWSVTSEVWPAPETSPVGRDSAFTYSGPFSIRASLVGPKARAKEPIRLVLSYGICREMCIPGELTLKLAP